MGNIIDRYLERRGFLKAADVQTKSAGFMALETAGYPEGRPDQEKIADYSTFVRAYSQLPWLYAGGLALAIASTKPDLKVLRETMSGKKADQEAVEGEALNKLLELPNPDTSYRELIQITVLNLSLLGNAYWNLVGTKEKTPISATNPPVEIWWVKPEQIQPLPDANGAIKGYEFTGPSGQKKVLDPSEIIHFRMPNPASYFIGMGAMTPLMNTATLEANAVSFQGNFLVNDGTPPLIVEHPGSPTKQQRDEFFRAWDERQKGPKKAGRAAMLWGGMKATVIGQTLKDAQYTELRKMNREETLAALPGSVPPSIVGLLEYANYSNMEVQSKKFWEDCVMPILGIVADKATLRLTPHFNEDYWLEYDYSKIKVLQEDDERRSRIAATLVQNGIKTPNEIRAEMFNGKPYKGGDQFYMSMAMIPVGTSAGEWWAQDDKAKGIRKRLQMAVKARAEAGETEEKPSFWAAPERKKALWQAFEKRVTTSERAVQPEVEKYLKQQASEVKARAEKADSVGAIRITDLFDINDEAKTYLERFEARYRQAFERAGNAGYQATKGMIWIPPEERKIKDADEFRITAEHLAKLKAQIDQSAQFFNETTWKVIEVEIKNAIAEGLTVQEAANEIQDSLVSRATWESRRIARTEMARTENWGGLEGYRQNEYVDRKGWLCTFAEESRDEHMAADGQEVGLDEDFIVGGEQLAYPGDPRGSAGNTINCLCSHYPIVSEV